MLALCAVENRCRSCIDQQFLLRDVTYLTGGVGNEVPDQYQRVQWIQNVDVMYLMERTGMDGRQRRKWPYSPAMVEGERGV
jgi:hypothetical protein